MKKVICIILLISLILSFTSCKGNENSKDVDLKIKSEEETTISEKDSVATDKSSFSNIIYASGGFYKCDGKYLAKIAKIEVNADKPAFTFDQNTLYYCYTNGEKEGEIRSRDLKTGNEKTLNKDYCSAMIFKDGYLYYYNYSKSAITGYNVENGTYILYENTRSNTFEDIADNLFIKSDKIYYTQGDLKCIDIKDPKAEPEILCDLDAYYSYVKMVLSGDTVFYSNLNNTVGGEIVKYNLLTKEKETVRKTDDKVVDFLYAKGEELYYILDGTLYKYSNKTSTEIANGLEKVSEFCIEDKILYYVKESNEREILAKKVDVK